MQSIVVYHTFID